MWVGILDTSTLSPELLLGTVEVTRGDHWNLQFFIIFSRSQKKEEGGGGRGQEAVEAEHTLRQRLFKHRNVLIL